MTEKTTASKEFFPVSAIRYAEVLLELGIEKETVTKVQAVFEENPELQAVLSSAAVSKSAKHTIIDRVFQGKMRNYLKVVSDHNKMESIKEIFAAYLCKKEQEEGVITATLSYVTLPKKEQLESMEALLCKKFHAKSVKWDMRKEPDLIGGFLLYINGREYDYSIDGRLKRLEEKLTRR